MSLTSRPSVIQWNTFSFVIMDAPNDTNLHLYVKELKKNNVTDIARACEVTYDKMHVETAGIKVHELEFPDGEPPNSEVIDAWLDLVDQVFENNPVASANSLNEGMKSIAVHCVAGLGRAPVLVAIALIENGTDPINAVELIRKHRRGAINLRQLKYLEKYQPRRSKKEKCSIM